MAAETTQQNGQRIHQQQTPEDPLNLAGDRLRVNDAIHVQNLVKSQKFLDSVRDAETKTAYPGIDLPKGGDDMIAVDSNFKTEHHYHSPPQAKSSPAWLAPALLVAALAGTAGGGFWLSQSLKPSGGAATTTKPITEPPKAAPTEPAKSKSYELDFWNP